MSLASSSTVLTVLVALSLNEVMSLGVCLSSSL